MRLIHRFACWLDLKMHDALDRHLTFTLPGWIAMHLHSVAHELAYWSRAR